MSMYRVVYTRKGETKRRLHIASPTNNRAKAQSVVDNMNRESKFFRWGTEYYLEVADHGEWCAT